MPLTKLAESLLQEHQQRVLDRLADPSLHGLVAYHSTGSGKTLTALKALQRANEQTGKRGLFVVPASLVENAKKEIIKHNIPLSDKNLDIKSYEWAAKHSDALNQTPHGMVVFDEAHKLRNSGTARAQALRGLANNADKVLLLTGTAGYNSPSDISSLVRFVDKNSKLPANDKLFMDRYVSEDFSHLKNIPELKERLGKFVDVYRTPQNASDFPTVTEKITRVPMGDHQNSIYKSIEAEMPARLRAAVHNRLPLTKQDAASLNMFATGVRQAALSPTPYDTAATPDQSAKLVAAVNSISDAIKQPRFRGVVYSNYLDAGLYPYADMLRKRGIEPLVFTGKLNAKEKKALVDDYNSDDPKGKVLLVSSSGGEGLDLKNTRRIQILEPHFNAAKIDQVIGRGARYKSHSTLPEKDRNILIERFHATRPRKWHNKLFNTDPPGAIDDYLYEGSVRKANVIGQLRDLLEERNGFKN